MIAFQVSASRHVVQSLPVYNFLVLPLYRENRFLVPGVPACESLQDIAAWDKGNYFRIRGPWNNRRDKCVKAKDFGDKSRF